MSTNFPGGIDTTTILKNDATDATLSATVHPAQHNNVADALIAIETELGANPSNAYATVAAAIADMIAKTPTGNQTVTPTGDSVALILKLASSLYVSDFFEAKDSTNTILAFLDHTGIFSAQALKIAGTLLAVQHLSDGKQVQKKDQAFAFSHVQGVTPGLSGDPQTALKVTAASSWNLSIAAGSALIQGTDNTAEGMYQVTQTGTATLALPTHAPGSNSRVDAICVRYNDSLYTGRTPADTFEFIQVTGTATSGANLTNLTGKPATPASSLLLAYILVNSGDTGVSSGNVLDQRILTGPAVWGEDGHRYRIAVNSNGQLYLGQIV